MLGGVHGNDEAKVYANCARPWKKWLKCSTGPATNAAPLVEKEFSGKFVLRVEPTNPSPPRRPKRSPPEA